MPAMNAQHPLETVIRRTTSQPLRFKFAVLYVGITGAITYLNGLAHCSNDTLVDQTIGIGVLLLALLGLEWFEQNRSSNDAPTSEAQRLTPRGVAPSRRMALALLVVRMLLIEGILFLDCNRTALLLYPMIPYSAYFSFGSQASMAFSLAYVLLTAWRTSQAGSAWYLEPGTASNLLAFTFVMLFAPLVAHIIRRDDEHRLRTEQLLADLEISHLRLQAYTEQVAELAAAEERNRLARDIHDSLGHYLTAISIQLEKALLYQERNPAEAEQAIRDARQAAAEALSDVRLSVSALRSPDTRFSLHDSLERLVQGNRDDRLNIQLSIQGDESGYSRSALMALYRAAQEGLTNIQKHAQASLVQMSIELGEHEGRLSLRDNGRGFEPASLDLSSQPQPGFGLRGIRERIEMARGRLALHSSPQQGVELVVVVPRQPASATNPPPAGGRL
ncbi:MAG: sensor histidine kinase [Anaerolineales bacterium]|nr:sensor histidine kinase [Anaerolineales bacterium]